VNAPAVSVNASTATGMARAAGIALILVLTAGAGLAVGNLIQQLTADRSITAEASFSREALDDVNALRGGSAAAATYPDYAIRHAPAVADFPDWALRHPVLATPTTDTFRLTGPSDVAEPTAAKTSDTFRLTGPSDVGGALRGQPKAD
jgi:hypothetical protein